MKEILVSINKKGEKNGRRRQDTGRRQEEAGGSRRKQEGGREDITSIVLRKGLWRERSEKEKEKWENEFRERGDLEERKQVFYDWVGCGGGGAAACC